VRARDNPFRSARVLALRYRLEIPWPALIERWTSLGRVGAIVGPPGTGKTTLLEGLTDVLRDRGERVQLLRLTEEGPDLPGIEPGAVVLLDSAGLLTDAAFRRFRQRAAAWVVTAHGPGRGPTLWECRTSAELLDGLLDELGVPEWRAEARALFARKPGNVREVLRALYDRCALTPAPE
jgi:hypothetical protein